MNYENKAVELISDSVIGDHVRPEFIHQVSVWLQRDDTELIKTSFTNKSRRMWTEEECRVMVNAALAKLINDAGGMITVKVSDMFEAAKAGTLAMSLSDDDKILTLTRVKEA